MDPFDLLHFHLIYFISTITPPQPIPIVIIDSLTAGMAGAKGQCNFRDEVDPVLRSLERLAVDFTTAVCYHIIHMSEGWTIWTALPRV